MLLICGRKLCCVFSQASKRAKPLAAKLDRRTIKPRVGSNRKLGPVTVTVSGYYGYSPIPPVTSAFRKKLLGNELLSAC